jgi:large subunit ribosomal protein L36e
LNNMPIAVGLDKGYETEKRTRPTRRAKGAKTAKIDVCREIVREVAGLLPYERRLLDMLKTGGASSEKRMYKFAKKRLGSHKRAVKKRDDIKEVYSSMRAKAAM